MDAIRGKPAGIAGVESITMQKDHYRRPGGRQARSCCRSGRGDSNPAFRSFEEYSGRIPNAVWRLVSGDWLGYYKYISF